MDIKRKYEHADYGTIGAVTLSVPDGDWMLNGHTLAPTAVAHLAMFSLQTLQDSYAGAKNAAEAAAAFDKKLGRILEGKIGIREGGPRDPVRTRAITIASGHAKVKKVGDKFEATLGSHKSVDDKREKAVRNVALAAVKSNPAYTALADKQVAEEKELGIEPEELGDEEEAA